MTDEEPQTPDQIRAEIERTQQQMGDTVEALAEKTDVKAQAAKRVQRAKETVLETKEDLLGRAREATPESASAGAQQIAGTVQSKPLPFATAGAFAAGVLLGWLIGRA